jgi:signal transduction histidine kinase
MTQDVKALEARIEELEREIARLRGGTFEPSARPLVRAPAEVQPLFDHAEEMIGGYFKQIQIDPARAMIGVGDERYLLVRASAFSIDFLDTLVQLYADRGQREALAIGRGFLFDIAHTIGFHDARTIHEKLGSQDPLEKLSGGPVHFAYTGWSLVDIKPSSVPSPDENYCLIYDHPYSFEAAAWLKAGRKSEGPVCIMNAGYSSGWCEASFGIDLTAVEIACKARGDEACTFVMAPPARIAERAREHFNIDLGQFGAKGFDVPTYFERKKAEEDLRQSYRKLQEAQNELIRKERLATVGLLVAGVAHEVNTPLGVAVTATSVVADELAGLQQRFDAQKLTRGDLREFLDRTRQAEALVRSNLERAASQITSFKRVSVDHVTEERRRVDVGAYVRQTLESLGPVLRRHQIEVDVVTEGELEVTTNPGAIAQIITNFVTNTGAHGRPAGAPVTPLHAGVVVRRSEKGTVVLSYTDDGQGMTAEVRAQAFQPFFTTARGGGGTGLGLHIVHSLAVDVLGGRLDLTTAPGKGVHFEVELGAS